MTQRTYYPPREEVVVEPAWTPAPDDVHTLRHGYNLADLHQLATRAMWRVWGVTIDQRARYEMAWSAIAEAIYAAPDDQPPHPVDLIHAGQDAISSHMRDEARHHGLDKSNGYQIRHGFVCYWELPIRHAGSPEPGVVDKTALWQIWAELSDTHRQALLALASAGTHQAAAESLGIPYRRFKQHLGDARRRFLAFWHEGEQPSRIWGSDQRVYRIGGAPVQTTYRSIVGAVRRGRTPRAPKPKVEPVHGKASTYNNHKCRCALCVEAKRIEGVERRARAGITPRQFKTRQAAVIEVAEVAS